LPPRAECAPLWHKRLLGSMPHVRLTLLAGIHAQGAYLQESAAMTEAVRGFARHGPWLFPLPHPSWRSVGWMRRNPWFETEVVPCLRERIALALAR